jgi:hypothetical protein
MMPDRTTRRVSSAQTDVAASTLLAARSVVIDALPLAGHSRSER